MIDNVTVLQCFKARQVHGIHEDGKIFMEPSGCLACLYSRVSESCKLQAACVSACPCLTHVDLAPHCGCYHGTCPLVYVSRHHPPAGSSYLFKY